MAQINEEMIKELMAEGLLENKRIHKAFEDVDRADFIPQKKRQWAYVNYPIEIEDGQSISQPWTVAFMTEALDAGEGMKVLEIGSCSGY